MPDVTYNPIDRDEPVIVENPPARVSKAPEVEIISNGVSRLVYVNGHRVDKVLDIDTNAGLDDLNPRVALTLHARSVTQRLVSAEEWKRLALGGALEG